MPKSGTSLSNRSFTWITTADESSDTVSMSKTWMTGSKLELSTDWKMVLSGSA